MVRDVASVARYLHARIIPGTVDDTTPVDAVVALHSLTVVGHHGFATLVVATPDEILSELSADIGADRSALLRSSVFVSHDADEVVSGTLARYGVTALVETEPSHPLLEPVLRALLATDQSAEDRAVTSAVRVLTLAARRGGVPGVLAELAHRIDGWAVLLDRHGEVISTAGAGSLHVHDAAAVALGMPVRIRHRSLQVHPVGPGEDITARLVVAPRAESSGRGRELGSQAAALLDLVLRTHDPDRTERLGRSVMIDTLLRGGPESAALLREWRVYEPSLTGFALASRSSNVDVERLVAHWVDELGATRVFTSRRGVVSGFLRDDHVGAISERVEAYSATLFLGIGQPAPVDTLRHTYDEAQQALAMAKANIERVLRYQSMPTVRFIFSQLDSPTADHLAALLDPLRTDGAHGDLTRTLQVFLEENGAWGATAARLSIHRQTLTNRIRQIEDATGLSMLSADDRTAAWLALRALGTR